MFEFVSNRLRRGFKFGNLVIFREKSGVIGNGPQWVIFEDEFMYTGDTLFQALKQYTAEHRHDKHMVG